MIADRNIPDGVAVHGGSGMIDGVTIVPLRRIPDERGTIYHMLRCTDPHFLQFGEIYFSAIYPGAINGWHKLRDSTTASRTTGRSSTAQLRPLDGWLEDE